METNTTEGTYRLSSVNGVLTRVPTDEAPASTTPWSGDLTEPSGDHARCACLDEGVCSEE